jgi:hypothetical protein
VCRLVLYLLLRFACKRAVRVRLSSQLEEQEDQINSIHDNAVKSRGYVENAEKNLGAAKSSRNWLRDMVRPCS